MFSNLFEIDRAYLSLFKSRTMRNDGDCILYGHVGGKNGYVQLTKTETVRLPSGKCRKVNERVHRIAVMAKLRIHRIPDFLEASHLCARKNCVNPSHVSLEMHADNAGRATCLTESIRIGQSFCHNNHGEHAQKCIISIPSQPSCHSESKLSLD